jgi:SAM-dependent methyltransferase
MINMEQIDHGKGFDWGRTSGDYAKYRDIYPVEFYERIVGLGICGEGQNVLDLGTGTGVLPRNLSRYGARFTGADISAQQIAEAGRLSEEAGLEIDYLVSPAEDVAFPDNTFDAVTASQCYMYFDMDRLIPKLYRILKAEGHFCLLYMGWLTEESEIARMSEKLVLKYNPHWTGAEDKRHPIPVPGQIEGSFHVENQLLYDIGVPFTRESWNGRIKACRGIGASDLSETEIASFEKEHLEYLSHEDEKFIIPHYVSVLDLKSLKK